MPVKSVTTKTVEAPLLAEHVGHQPFVGCGGHAVYLVEGGHYASHTCLYGGFIGIHVFVEHAVTAHVYRIVVTTCLTCPIEGEMLDAGKDLVVTFQLVIEVGSLITVDHCFGNCSAKERVLATALADTSPARSRLMSTIGLNVHEMPSALASTAAMRADS